MYRLVPILVMQPYKSFVFSSKPQWYLVPIDRYTGLYVCIRWRRPPGNITYVLLGNSMGKGCSVLLCKYDLNLSSAIISLNTVIFKEQLKSVCSLALPTTYKGKQTFFCKSKNSKIFERYMKFQYVWVSCMYVYNRIWIICLSDYI